MVQIKKGIDIPIAGAPKDEISLHSTTPKQLAILGPDYVGMKPTMKVQVGDRVKIGDALFIDKKTSGVVYTSPANGEVLAVNRGAKRVLESVVISNEGEEAVNFSGDNLKELLIESGEWGSIRVRPFDKVADPNEDINHLFITAMDTNPLAGNVVSILNHENNLELFQSGLKALASLVKERIYICTGENFTPELGEIDKVKKYVFTGPHPAGNPGTHIHFLSPVSANKKSHHLNFQDVMAIGHLVKHKSLFTYRYISFAGPRVRNPRILKVRRGTEINETFKDEVYDFNDARLISGSILHGRNAQGSFNYLGRFHNQVSVLQDSAEREFLGWQSPGLNKYSIQRTYISAWLPKRFLNFTTNLNGSFRAIVPVGSYEKVMPMDILATPILRSIMSEDTERSAQLGALELAEEDLALCSFVDPGKEDFGKALRVVLEKIEKDG